jgi:outer membrane protein TolC
MSRRNYLLFIALVIAAGCAGPASRAKLSEPERQAAENPPQSPRTDQKSSQREPRARLALQSRDQKGDTKPPFVPPAPSPDEAAERLMTDRPNPPDALFLPELIASVHGSFPLIDAALQEIPITSGNLLAAWGEFDLKLKAESENGPTGFYQTYRNSAGFLQPMYHGGEVFGGYRIGRGDFQPWYLERQTNDGGEFRAGVRVPLARNRAIDARRAALWRADYDQQLAQPEIRGQLIAFVRDASVLYWAWVAEGRKYEIGRAALRLSEERNEGLEKRVEQGDLDPPALRDNERTIASRQARLIDRERKLEQAAVKLSLFLRTLEGVPLIPDRGRLPNFPDPPPVDPANRSADIELALAARPELESLRILYDRVEVDAAEASNDLLPNVDAQFVGSQDVGQPTSKKRDKSQFELEVGVFVDVPLQRRKGFGKLGAARGKQAQIAAKRRFTQDKIAAEVQAVYAALSAAYDRVAKTREAREGAEFLADIERRKFDLGQSDLLSVFLREQLAIEAADDEVDALLEYYIARAEYAAALAYQWVNDRGEPDGRGCFFEPAEIEK